MLKDLGLINTLGSRQERTRFDANLNRHHHFILKVSQTEQRVSKSEPSELMELAVGKG
jgi:Fe2+ or Zn2+ uptake regulation protein